ncbi:MAG: zinc ribbon domain-containing protein [Acidobacteria bacterium]|nr:zinc ribbon domain-containing protein [Acidobacteriota bacterium]
MPLYEYKCRKCGKRFERLVSPGKDKDIACDACGSPESAAAGAGSRPRPRAARAARPAPAAPATEPPAARAALTCPGR